MVVPTDLMLPSKRSIPGFKITLENTTDHSPCNIVHFKTYIMLRSRVKSILVPELKGFG